MCCADQQCWGSKGNKSILIPELWLCKHTQPDTAAGQRGMGEWLGREMEGPLQTSPLISKDDAINRTGEHLHSASEQGPWEGWASAGVTISSGAFSPNKNISFLHRLNRDPQHTFFKSQPGEESKGQLPGWWALLANRETEKCPASSKNLHTSTEINCACTAPTKQGKHPRVRGAEATSGASRCDFCCYPLICHLCPCKYEANIDL